MKGIALSALLCGLLLAMTGPTGAVAGELIRASHSVIDSHISASTNAVTGASVHGLAVALHADSPSLTTGQRIVLNIEVRNTSDSDRNLLLPASPCSYAFQVKNLLDGNTKTFQPYQCDVYGGLTRTIPPGMSHFLTFTFSDYLNLAPGSSSVSVTGLYWYPTELGKPEFVQVSSNTVTIRIQS